MKTLLAEHNEYISVLNEDGKTDVLLKEGANKGMGWNYRKRLSLLRTLSVSTNSNIITVYA